MKRLVAILIMVAGACGCTPAQIAAVTQTSVIPPTDYVLRWMCPTGSYDSAGHQIYFWVNTAGYRDMSRADRLTCVAIKPVDMA